MITLVQIKLIFQYIKIITKLSLTFQGNSFNLLVDEENEKIPTIH